MKTFLLMFIVGICALALRSPDLMQALGVAASAQDPVVISTSSYARVAESTKPMSMDQFAALSKTDPNAYQKFINSYQVQERNEVDKVMNFFTRGKYE